jgi:hypothetical protein
MHLKQKDTGLYFAALILATPLVIGCATSRHATPAYAFQKPSFQVTPQVIPCEKETPATEKAKVEVVKEQCVVLLVSDFVKLLAELETTCLATGNDAKTCTIISRGGK